MRVIVAKIFAFPTRTADLVYHLNQASELIHLGVEVVIWLRPLQPLDRFIIARHLEGYGLKPIPGLRFRVLYFKNKPLSGMEFRVRLLVECLRRNQKVLFVPSHLRIGYQLVRLRSWLKFRSPIVYEIHNLDHVIQKDRGDPGHQRSYYQEAYVYENADAIVSISEPLLEMARNRFSRLCSRIAVLPQGVQPAMFGNHAHVYQRPSVIKSDDHVKVVYTGSLYAFKGVSLLLESFLFLPERVHLRVVGGHPKEALEELKRKACEWGIDHRVHFIGDVPHTSIGQELIEADILALPLGEDNRSVHFTSPIKLFEYLYAGRPMVVTDFPTTRSIIGDEQACVFVDQPSPQAFAKAISFLLDHPAKAQQLAQRARKIGEGYTWHVRAVRLQAFFGSLLKHQ
jgi:glycosyltransferase involved in cell wall biosynthesis